MYFSNQFPVLFSSFCFETSRDETYKNFLSAVLEQSYFSSFFDLAVTLFSQTFHLFKTETKKCFTCLKTTPNKKVFTNFAQWKPTLRVKKKKMKTAVWSA